MSSNVAEIVAPLVNNGLYENAETAVKDLMAQHIVHQIERYHAVIEQFEEKYGMRYSQFTAYLNARAKQLASQPALQKKFMLEEEDALDWKIAGEMLDSWLGLKGKSAA